MKKLLFYITVFSLFFSCSNANKKVEVNKLICEYCTNPTGIDVQKPRFSWKIISKERGIYQQSYRIIVGKNLSDIKNKNGECWDTGITKSDNTVNIEYNGTKLESNTDYFWRVLTVLTDGTAVWSSPAIFHTGLFNKTDWKAKWITTEEEIEHASPLFRKKFKIEKEIKQAIAFTTAGGNYEFYINGEKVGERVLEPAITDYRKTVLYSAFDVTELLQKGENVAGAMLGNGAYNMRKMKGRYSWGQEGSTFGNPCVLAQINITFTDGTKTVVKTDNSWKYSPGPITFNNIYGGEDYDARKEIAGWSTPDYSAKNWKNAVLASAPRGALKAQLMPPAKVIATLKPVAHTNPSPGVYLYDLGQNISGWWRIKVKGTPGLTIRVRGAETLNDSLFSEPLKESDKLSTKFNYHAQVWTDYTTKSSNTETYEPRFFYTGFRYIEIVTSNKKNLKNITVEGRVVHTALQRNGTFVTSDSLLNRIHRAGLWSQIGNTVSYPTDCPHREKGAYNGDGEIIAETSIHDFQMAAFYTKWLNDMSDAQEENGRIPNTSPTLVGGMGGGIAWGSAYILLPWWMHNYYNDTRVLNNHYKNMKRYIGYLKNLAKTDSNPDEPLIINDFDSYWYSLGEWCAPNERDGPNHPVVNTFYFYYNTLLMAKIAKTVGKTNDAKYFSALSDSIKTQFNKTFLNKKTYLYGTSETYQTYQLLVLIGQVVPAQFRKDVYKTVVDDIVKTHNGHLNTGIIGTKYLWPVLVNGGDHELAYKVATQTTFPSYGYWIENGATTLLEEWTGVHSHNHEMFGSVVEYFYKYLAGIQSPLEGNTSVGYKHIHLQPYIPQKLNRVNASVETVAGKIVSNWKNNDNKLIYNVEIPANTTATIVLPLFFKNATLTESGSVIWENGSYKSGIDGISGVKAENKQISISIKSGSYNFELQ